MPTDLNTCTFYFVVVCARSSHPVRRQPASATAAAAWRRACVTALDDDARGRGTTERARRRSTLRYTRSRADVRAAVSLVAVPLVTLLECVTRTGLCRRPDTWAHASVIGADSWLLGSQRFCANAAWDRSIIGANMIGACHLWTCLGPGRTTWHGKGGTTCARSPAM